MKPLVSHRIGVHRFVPSGAAFLRTPLFPLKTLLDFSEDLQTPAALHDGRLTEEIYQQDNTFLRQRLTHWLANPAFSEAIFLGSPSLEERTAAYLERPDREEGKRIERSLYKYFSRMCARSTPFGIFAGCSLVRFDRQTDLSVAAFADYRRRSRLDMNFVSELAMNVEKDAGIKDELLFFPNPSLYTAAGRSRYIESRMINNRRLHHLIAIEQNEFLDFALDRARAGIRPPELAAAIAGFDPEVGDEEAAAFVDDLINSQILISEVTLNVTGPDVVERIITTLSGCANAREIVPPLAEAKRILDGIDTEPLGLPTRTYRDLAAGLESLPAKIDLKTVVQVDLFKPAPEATLGSGVVKEVLRGIELLHKVTPYREHPGLSRFKEEFQARYEDREIPLVEVLDEEVGIGFEKSFSPSAEESPLLVGLGVGGGGHPARGAGGSETDRRTPLLLRILTDALRDGGLEYELSDKIVSALTLSEKPDLPDSLSTMFVVMAADQRRLDSGDFRIWMETVVGPPGSRFLGRFCHLDPEFEQAVKSHVRQEEVLHPKAIFAEIVHLPEGRIGNILFRPILRDHEIPILGFSTLPGEFQIPLTDLTIRSQGGRIVLRSRKLGREILPRLSSAHNFGGHSIGIYKFLGALQAQGHAGSGFWSWGPLDDSPFLPRLVHGRLILSLATWKLAPVDIEAWRKDDGLIAFNKFQAWRAQRHVPRFCELAEGDNKLFLDLENPLAVDTLLELTRKRARISLTEIHPAPDQLVVQGPEGLFRHEMIMPVVRLSDLQDARPKIPAPSTAAHDAKRSATVVPEIGKALMPGSDWLFAKIYCGVSDADYLLRDPLGRLLERAEREKWMDGWFFLRYGDPDWHLRLRIHGDPRVLAGKILPALHEAIAGPLSEGRVHRLVLDTYQREVERYGGPLVFTDFEKYFRVDSDAVLTIIQNLKGDSGQDDRWRLTLLGLDMVLEDFGLNLSERLEMMEKQAEGFSRDIGMNKHLGKQIGQKFRGEREALVALLERDLPGESPLATGLEAFRVRHRASRQIVADLHAKAGKDQMARTLPEILSSVCHLHTNRLLRSAARAQEAVIYHLLVRLYRLLLARTG